VSFVEQKYTESPEIMSWVDSAQSLLIVQFTVIQAEQENITLMMNEDGCYLSAPTEDVEYIATLSFLHPVKPSETTATYKDGYLTVKAPLKEPLNQYIKIQVK
jgi:HSP20 family molecular chaperone IbpA